MPLIIRSHIIYPERQKAAPKLTHREIRVRNFEAKPWSEIEDEAMRKSYRIDGAKFLAERFGRSPKAVQQRAVTLRLTKKHYAEAV